MSGEQQDHYPPAGGAPQPPTLTSNPLVDRHIAQRNLAPFDPAEIGMKKIKWANFIVAQAGAGWNELTVQTALPADAVHFYVAIPKAAYERWIDPRTSKGGVVRGLEVTSDAPSKPFPEAVILRQTGRRADPRGAACRGEGALLRHVDRDRGRPGRAAARARQRRVGGAQGAGRPRRGRLHAEGAGGAVRRWERATPVARSQQ